MKNLQSFLRSFAYAGNGLKYFFVHERNGKIQLAIAFFTIALSVILKINMSEWIAVLLCTAMVLGLEMMNSALEKLCDMVQSDYHPKIKIVKDISAGAVLLASIISAAIGMFIFLPKLFILF